MRSSPSDGRLASSSELLLAGVGTLLPSEDDAPPWINNTVELNGDDTRSRNLEDRIRILELEKETKQTQLFPMSTTPELQAVTASEVQAALRTDRLAREWQVAHDRIQVLEAQLADSTDQLRQREDELRHASLSKEEELGKLCARLKDAEQATVAAEESAKRAKDDACHANEQLRVLQEELSQAKVELAVQARELDATATLLNSAESETAVAYTRKQAVERNMSAQLREKELRAEELRTECAELRVRLEVLEAAVRGHEAKARAFTLPGDGSAEGRLLELRRQYDEDRLHFECSKRELERIAERRGEQLQKYEVENRCLREHRNALQAEADRATVRLQELENVEADRQQLGEEVATLRGQLAETLRQLRDAEAEAGLLASRLAARVDGEVLSKLPETAWPEWLAPVARRAEQAEGLLGLARQGAAAALGSAHMAREEAADAEMKLASQSEEGTRVQWRLVETRMRLDQCLDRELALAQSLREVEARAAADLETQRVEFYEQLHGVDSVCRVSEFEAQRLELCEEHGEALKALRAEERAQAAFFENAMARKDEELLSMSRQSTAPCTPRAPTR